MSFNNSYDFVIQKANLTEIQTQNNYITNQETAEPLSPIKNTPPSTTRNFTGQDEYLKTLHVHLGNSDSPGRKMFLLYGMGGIGKTQICLKYMDETFD
ncbi:hypothetical protein BDQ17DRAFT_1349946 [Cyathus striatus]|nr:hypothetical protein BDQ17DRAFT_1349946 [Cyathus striatus]